MRSRSGAISSKHHCWSILVTAQRIWSGACCLTSLWESQKCTGAMPWWTSNLRLQLHQWVNVLCFCWVEGQNFLLSSTLMCLSFCDSCFMLCYWEQLFSVPQVDSKSCFLYKHLPQSTKCKKQQENISYTFQLNENDLWKNVQKKGGLWALGVVLKCLGVQLVPGQSNHAFPAGQGACCRPSFRICLGVPQPGYCAGTVAYLHALVLAKSFGAKESQLGMDEFNIFV